MQIARFWSFSGGAVFILSKDVPESSPSNTASPTYMQLSTVQALSLPIKLIVKFPSPRQAAEAEAVVPRGWL
jgi:hypothetical protein